MGKDKTIVRGKERERKRRKRRAQIEMGQEKGEANDCVLIQ